MHSVKGVPRLRSYRAAARLGFTMVELLVVVALIALLLAIILVSVGGATESARAVTCLTNMRNLAQAANNYALLNRYYPTAGSLELCSPIGEGGYVPSAGWISWLDNNGQYQSDDDGNISATGHQSCEIVPFDGDGVTFEDAEYAITNGSLWAACNYNRKLYTCPEHNLYRRKHNLKAALWSYVMNAKFRYDSTKGNGAIPGERAPSELCPNIKYGQLSRADRTLMFAELPLYDPTSGAAAEFKSEKDGGDIYDRDCVLNYRGGASGKVFGDWSGNPETIGFAHRLGKQGFCAHVVFADAHTEKLLFGDEGITLQDMTAMLCEGVDVVFDGAGYQMPNDAEEMADDGDEVVGSNPEDGQ